MFKQLIAGELVEGDGKPLEVINPTTGKVLEAIDELNNSKTKKEDPENEENKRTE